MPKNYLTYIPLIFLIYSLVSTACSSESTDINDAYEYIQNDLGSQVPDSVINNYMKYQFKQSETNDVVFDLDKWHLINKDEILRTLETVEFIQADSIGIALYRFSVGSKIFRESLWLRKYSGKWYASTSQFYSEYNNDPFNDGNRTRALDVIKKEKVWRENSSTIF